MKRLSEALPAMPQNARGTSPDSPRTPQHGSTVADGLTIQRHGRSMDAALMGSLPASVRSGLVATVAERTGPHGWEGEEKSYRLAGEIPAADVAEARAILERANRPAEREMIVDFLARLRALTKARDGTAMEAAAYVAELERARYPADVIREACRAIANDQTWFPSWHELRDACEWRVRRRRLMLEAIGG